MAGRTGKGGAPSPHHRGVSRRLAARPLRAALRRLDRAAGRTNPFLLVIAIGLLLLNISCFGALRLFHLPPPAVSAQFGVPGALPVPYNR